METGTEQRHRDVHASCWTERRPTWRRSGVLPGDVLLEGAVHLAQVLLQVDGSLVVFGLRGGRRGDEPAWRGRAGTGDGGLTVRARSRLMVDWDSSCRLISFSHLRQFCTYSWLPRLRLLRDRGQRTAQDPGHRTGQRQCRGGRPLTSAAPPPDRTPSAGEWRSPPGPGRRGPSRESD